MYQDAKIVKRIKSPAVHRFVVDDPKSDKQGDLCRIPSGLPEDRSKDLSSHFKVIHKEKLIRDEDVNERIQREGAEVSYRNRSTLDQPLTGEESEWYMKHKGYSKRLS
jgi:hypothetical protein